VLGHEAMQKMSVAHVLIIGLKGLGVEIGTFALLLRLRVCASANISIY
jgi:ubiquitin-activating enzyme E1